MSGGVEWSNNQCESERLKICAPRDCYTQTQAPTEMPVRSQYGQCSQCPHCQRQQKQKSGGSSKKYKPNSDRLFCGCYETRSSSGPYLPACQCPRPCPCPTCPNYKRKLARRSVSDESRVTQSTRCTCETSSRKSYESTVNNTPCGSYRKPAKETETPCGSYRDPVNVTGTPCGSYRDPPEPRQQCKSDNAERVKDARLEFLEYQMQSLQANMNCLLERLRNKQAERCADSKREASIVFESSSYVTYCQEEMQRVDYYIRPEDCPPCPPCPTTQKKDPKKNHSSKHQPVSDAQEVSSSSLVQRSNPGESKHRHRKPSKETHVKSKTEKEKKKEEKQRIKKEKEERIRQKKEEKKREKEKKKQEKKRGKKVGKGRAGDRESEKREKERERSERESEKREKVKERSERERVKEPKKGHTENRRREIRAPRDPGMQCRCSYSARKSMPKLHPSPTPYPRQIKQCEESVQFSKSLAKDNGERKVEKAVQTVCFVNVATSATIIVRPERPVQARQQTPEPHSSCSKMPAAATRPPCGNSPMPPTSQNPRNEATPVKCPKPPENPPVESPTRYALPKPCSRCQMCCNGKRMAILKRDLHVQVKNLIGMQQPRYVALTIVKESPDLYHINVALMRSGQSLGCLYCTEAALSEALKHHFLEEFVTFFVMDSHNNEAEKVQFFNFSFECIK